MSDSKSEILWETETRGLLTVGGYLVPHVVVVKHTAPERDGLISLTLDGRYSIDLTDEELEKWAWWFANAMAIAAGYSCLGANSVQLNPYARKCHRITSASDAA